MAIPEGYKALAKIGFAYKGEYTSGTNYNQLDAVYYLGSTYVALIDNPVGVPNNDGVNWRYLAQGSGGASGGDMLKSVYDLNNNGIVDNAEKLGGQPPSYYQSQIDDLKQEVELNYFGLKAVKTTFNADGSITEIIGTNMARETTFGKSEQGDTVTEAIYEIVIDESGITEDKKLIYTKVTTMYGNVVEEKIFDQFGGEL